MICLFHLQQLLITMRGFGDVYRFSELISNIRKVGKIDSRKMQGQSIFTRPSFRPKTNNQSIKKF